MNNKKSGEKTLLMSIVMSAPGPLILGLNLLSGKSSTQIADFVRRSAELLGIVMAYAVYRVTTKDGVCDSLRKQELERLSNLFVGAMMCLGGTLMFLLAITSDNAEKGNVIPGLIIALLGAIANTLFWKKYNRLNKTEPNAILAVQARLYRAKSLVDCCVSAALMAIVFFPKTAFSFYLDMIGSAVVAVYLFWCGMKTIVERLNDQSLNTKNL